MQIANLNVSHPSAFVRSSTFARRSAAFAIFACAGTLGLQAQQQPASSATQPGTVLSASVTSPLIFPVSGSTSVSTDSAATYSSSVGAEETTAAENFIPSAGSETQPPPRRRYGQPRYADNSHNADGSNKWTGEAGVGATLPIGNTFKYDTDSYAYQVGFGRQWSKKFAVLLQFDWDNFGLEGSTLANYTTIYNTILNTQFPADASYDISQVDGNAHVWSFSLNPTFTLPTSGAWGAYGVVGVGFYHKVTTFTVPSTEEECSYYYGCFEYSANAAFDHYTSNAAGFNGGLGVTYKFSRFANERFFLEARYVFVDNSQRYGVTPQNLNKQAAIYLGNDYYPENSNHTTYIPIKVGIRF